MIGGIGRLKNLDKTVKDSLTLSDIINRTGEDTMQQFNANIRDARGFWQIATIMANNHAAARALFEGMYGKENVSGVRSV